MKKETTINIRSTDVKKSMAKRVMERHGFETMSSFYWYMVHYFSKKK